MALLLAAVITSHGAMAQGYAPCAGTQTHDIKALPSRQIADPRDGRAMGTALPAELNGYPGPMHVVEHADSLALDDAQRSAPRAILESCAPMPARWARG